MKARRTRVVSVGVLTCVLVLTGCSTGTPTTSPSATSTPAGSATSGTSGTTSSSTPSTDATSTAAQGDEVRARSGAFTVVPPEGWTEATDKASGVADVDVVLLSSKKVAGFANNLVVTTSDGDASVLADELAKGKQQMTAAGRVVSSAPDKVVGGATAVGFTTTFEQQGIKIVARSYGVVRQGRMYLLTLSASQTDGTHAMAELDGLLSTWAWT